MSKFKVGDRVIYDFGRPSVDCGTITELMSEGGAWGEEEWWVRWDSSGALQHAPARRLRPEPILVQLEQEDPQKVLSLELKLVGWIMKDTPTAEEIQAACKFLKFAQA